MLVRWPESGEFPPGSLLLRSKDLRRFGTNYQIPMPRQRKYGDNGGKPCHWIKVDGVRVHIPGCMGAAARGIHNCTCKPENQVMTVRELKAKVRMLEETNRRLTKELKKQKGQTP